MTAHEQSTDPECPSCTGATASPEGTWRCGVCRRTIPPITAGNPTSTDPEWLHEAVEDGARALLVLHEMCRDWESLDEGDRDMYRTLTRAAILDALPAITGGVAEGAHLPDWCACPNDCDCDGVLILTEDEVRNFGSEVPR